MAVVAPVPIPAGPPVPDSSLPEPTFDAQFEASLTWQRNELREGINATAQNVNNNALAAKDFAEISQSALSSAQTLTAFKGNWSDLTGALPKPATVLENGAYWVLLQDLPDVTAVRPGTNAAVWTPQILEARALGAVDLNTVANSGAYTFGAPANGPVGVVDGVLNVTRGGTVMMQRLMDSATGATWERSASALTTIPAYSAWGRVARNNDAGVALAGGAIDCSKGTYFTETVNGARTLSFANIPAGAYACVLEINHTSGAITLPVGSVWVAGAAPTLNIARRHLFFFQRALTGSGGWIVSALPNSAL